MKLKYIPDGKKHKFCLFHKWKLIPNDYDIKSWDVYECERCGRFRK